MKTTTKCGEITVAIDPLAGEPGKGPWVVLSDDHGVYWRDHVDETLAWLATLHRLRSMAREAEAVIEVLLGAEEATPPP